MEVAVLNEEEHQLSLQQQFGRRYNPDEIMIFQAQVIQPHTVVSCNFDLIFYCSIDKRAGT